MKQTVCHLCRYNTYPISSCIVIEDCSDRAGKRYGERWLDQLLLPLVHFPIHIIYNEHNIGQLASIDVAYSYVTTPWIFHCEEDWEFYRSGFIEDSLRILRLEPSYVTVALRTHDDLNSHPIMPPSTSAARPFTHLYRNIYSGFGLHPGLRRTLDYLKIAPIECAVEWPFYRLQQLFGHEIIEDMHWIQRFQYRATEMDIHKLFNKFGNSSLGAVTIEPMGYVRHTGGMSPTGAELSWIQDPDMVYTN